MKTICSLLQKDVDFRNSYFINKKPKKIIRIILGNISNENLIELFDQYLIQIQTCYQNNVNCYIEIGIDYFETF